MSAARGRAGHEERTDAEPPYRGMPGETRTQAIHVPLADGRTRSIAVHVAVNVGTDPELREAALNGALHRFDGGEELAIPFVFHDPGARRLCVVVPEVLRHTTLGERAKLLQAIAEDRDVSVPSYAREARAVIGSAGLAAFLEAPDDSQAARALAQAEDLLGAQRTALDMERGEIERLRAQFERERVAGAARDAEAHAERQKLGGEREALASERASLAELRAELDQREVRIRERAESVTSREDELRSRAEEQEAAQRDLAMREEELSSRLTALAEREQAAHARIAEASANAAQRVSISTGGSPIVMPDEASSDEVEELDELEPVNTEAGRTRAELGADDAGVEELVDDDDVEEEVDADALGVREEKTGVHEPHNVGAARAAFGSGSGLLGRLSGPTDIPPPPDEPQLPATLAAAEMALHEGDGVEIDVRLPEGVEGVRDLELLVQLSEGRGAPLVILALTMGVGGGREVVRAALDPRLDADRSMLEMLRRRFEARLHLYAHDGRKFDDALVSSPREGNLARILDRVQKLGGDAPVPPDLAKRAALAEPPPIFEATPFSADDDGRLENAAQVLRGLAEVAEWTAPARLEHVLTVLSVPREVVDATVLRVLERALAVGIVLPPVLAERAVSIGLVQDPIALTARLIDAFQRTVTRPDRGALDEQQMAQNWERLLAAASDGEIALDPETHEIAVRAIRAVRGDTTGSGPSGEIDAEKMTDLTPPELVVMLDHPKYRRAAAMALAERGEPQYADVLCKAVRKMPRADVVRVMPKMVRLGEEAGDVFIDGLSARKTFVRQAFALTLAHLKLRRAVVPLLHRLTAEETPIHRELARVVGTFGKAAMRPLVRQLSDPKAPEEPMVWALAHLALEGCEKQVQELANDGDSRVAGLASRALAARDQARVYSDAVLGRVPGDESDPVLTFSRRYEEELHGTAPESDLVTADDER